MILLVLLFLTQDAPPIAAGQDDIVVTARRAERLKRLRMTTRIDRKTGVTRCIFKRRSGDPALDAEVCGAVLDWVPRVATIAQMQACIAPTMNHLMDQRAAWTAGTPAGDL